MNVLLATYWPLPYTGGLWTFITEFRRGLKKKGINVDILSCSPDHSMYYLHDSPFSIRKTDILPLLVEKLNDGGLLLNDPSVSHAELNQYVFEISAAYFGLCQYDLIHAQDPIAARALARVKPAAVPLMTSLHGSLSSEIFYKIKSLYPAFSEQEIYKYPLYRYYRMVEIEGCSQSQIVHTSSAWLYQKTLSNLTGIHSNVFHIPYGFNDKNFAGRTFSFKKIPAKPADKKILFFSGRLVYLKGVHILLQALKHLKKFRSDWECWIAGDGEQREELEALAATLGISSNIRFLGSITNMSHYLKQSDIFIFPSLQDNQPFSIIEAQFSGLPVIVSDAAGLPEMVVPEENGLIFRSGDHEDLCYLILRLLEDSYLLNKCKKNAVKHAQLQWDSKKMINQLTLLYSRLIAEKELK
ncbi:glycosyltransferase family 4 protein [Fictibacillus aquaticus]|uniref:Uncharacterized protein n=1 Tax=Fictibacillus aquaticus TaxID=2021314 RepID=A0A235FCT9_9BACL|nr:glycosyltransferase family 4 protein [Fictibacillus aquaticus]OYD59148.1 hypothetical protein CGZ90_04420 [Fictibacillus aquaticus]